MSVRLDAATDIAAPLTRVWDELVDWAGQSRWIPFTTVRITTAYAAGLGVRADALSGVWLGRVPVGLLDRFVVTGWTPPAAGDGARSSAELEVLHLGPYFTGPGVFTLTGSAQATRVSCVELFDLPGGGLLEPAARLVLPLMRGGFTLSLRRFAAVCERG